MDRETLQKEYIERMLDGMDLHDLYMLATDYMNENLDKYTDEQLIAEVQEFNPDLLGENV